jgi:hypothetical protein
MAEYTLKFSNGTLQVSWDILKEFEYFKAYASFATSNVNLSNEINLPEHDKDIFKNIISDLKIFNPKYNSYYEYFQFNKENVNKIIIAKTIKDITKNNIITFAVDNNDYHAAKWFCETNELCKSYEASRALCIAVMMNNIKMVKLLIKNDVDTTTGINFSYSALMLAYKYKYKKIYKFLIKNNASFNYYHDLSLALENDDKDIIKFICDIVVISQTLSRDELFYTLRTESYSKENREYVLNRLKSPYGINNFMI